MKSPKNYSACENPEEALSNTTILFYDKQLKLLLLKLRANQYHSKSVPELKDLQKVNVWITECKTACLEFYKSMQATEWKQMREWIADINSRLNKLMNGSKVLNEKNKLQIALLKQQRLIIV